MKLQAIDSDVKYWVVRAGKGAKYFNHFQQNNIVALGHINSLTKSEGVIDSIEPEVLTSLFNDRNLKITSDTNIELISELSELLPEDTTELVTSNKALTSSAGHAEVLAQQEPAELVESPTVTDAQITIVRESANQIAAKVTQVSTFINTMNVGDIIITVNEKSVLLGTITSEPYIEDQEVFAYGSSGRRLERNLDYKLRRKVEWEPAKDRASIPKPIKPSLNAHQSIFSISDSNKELFSHWLYGMFLQDDSFYFSTKIKEQNKVSQFNLAEFQRAIQKLELLADKIANEDYDFKDDLIKSLEEQYILSGLNNDFTLTTKNAFMSPGNMWSEVTGSLKKRIVFAMLLGYLYGTTVEATQLASLSPKQVEVIVASAQIMKSPGQGNFDLYKKGIDADLDKPVKSAKEVKPDKLEGKPKFNFPKVKEKGDTGV